MSQFHIFKNIFVSESSFRALFIVVLTGENMLYFYALVSGALSFTHVRTSIRPSRILVIAQ